MTSRTGERGVTVGIIIAPHQGFVADDSGEYTGPVVLEGGVEVLFAVLARQAIEIRCGSGSAAPALVEPIEPVRQPAAVELRRDELESGLAMGHPLTDELGDRGLDDRGRGCVSAIGSRGPDLDPEPPRGR